MTRKKYAIIGRGTVGCMSALQLKLNFPEADIEWHYDPNVKPQAVGEGTTLVLPRLLHQTLNFGTRDYAKVDGYVKTGIFKGGWSENEDFLHDFPSPTVALHFNANKLQDYVHSRLKDHVGLVEHSVKADDIDADYVMDCSGRPADYSEHTQSDYIPVNAVHVTQCYWDIPKFSHTLAIARPYGWVFGIPLQNRCSVGYMYNSDINTLEEVKEDVKEIFSDYNLSPSEATNSFGFNNYSRKVNFTDRVTYNGNASFFLEPLEALTFGMANAITVDAMSQLQGLGSVDEHNLNYRNTIDNAEAIIMLHYLAGSKYDTPFWDFAKGRAEKCMLKARNNKSFCTMIEVAAKPRAFGTYAMPTSQEGMGREGHEFFQLNNMWWTGSFCQNLDGLGIRSKVEGILGVKAFSFT